MNEKIESNKISHEPKYTRAIYACETNRSRGSHFERDRKSPCKGARRCSKVEDRVYGAFKGGLVFYKEPYALSLSSIDLPQCFIFETKPTVETGFDK